MIAAVLGYASGAGLVMALAMLAAAVVVLAAQALPPRIGPSPRRVVKVRRVPAGRVLSRLRWHYSSVWPSAPGLETGDGVGGWSATWLGGQIAARLACRPRWSDQ